MPAYVANRLGDRQNFIYRHGFGESEIKSAWWNEALKKAGLGQFTVSVDPNGTGSERLTRGELFELAKTLQTVAPADEDEYLNFLWHVLAWGSGTSRRNNSDRIAAFAKRDDRRENIELLRKAAQHARDASAREAYRCLIRQGRGQIDRLGPAFFTKFLYFVGQGAIGYPCLIIDARVAESLYEAGWKLPRRPIDGRWDYSFNWHTDTYVSYCALLTRWADEQSERRYQVIATDEIERALFKGPRRLMP